MMPPQPMRLKQSFSAVYCILPEVGSVSQNKFILFCTLLLWKVLWMGYCACTQVRTVYRQGTVLEQPQRMTKGRNLGPIWVIEHIQTWVVDAQRSLCRDPRCGRNYSSAVILQFWRTLFFVSPLDRRHATHNILTILSAMSMAPAWGEPWSVHGLINCRVMCYASVTSPLSLDIIRNQRTYCGM